MFLYIYTHTYTYIHTPQGKKKKNPGLVLLPFCPKIKTLLPKNKLKMDFYLFSG